METIFGLTENSTKSEQLFEWFSKGWIVDLEPTDGEDNFGVSEKEIRSKSFPRHLTSIESNNYIARLNRFAETIQFLHTGIFQNIQVIDSKNDGIKLIELIPSKIGDFASLRLILNNPGVLMALEGVLLKSKNLAFNDFKKVVTDHGKITNLYKFFKDLVSEGKEKLIEIRAQQEKLIAEKLVARNGTKTAQIIIPSPVQVEQIIAETVLSTAQSELLNSADFEAKQDFLVEQGPKILNFASNKLAIEEFELWMTDLLDQDVNKYKLCVENFSLFQDQLKFVFLGEWKGNKITEGLANKNGVEIETVQVIKEEKLNSEQLSQIENIVSTHELTALSEWKDANEEHLNITKLEDILTSFQRLAKFGKWLHARKDYSTEQMQKAMKKRPKLEKFLE